MAACAMIIYRNLDFKNSCGIRFPIVPSLTAENLTTFGNMNTTDAIIALVRGLETVTVTVAKCLQCGVVGCNPLNLMTVDISLRAIIDIVYIDSRTNV